MSSQTTVDDIKKHLSEKQAELEQKRREVMDYSKDVFGTAIKAILTKYPAIQEISWTAYTPSFNDGDPCYYRSQHDYFDVNDNGDEGYEFRKASDENQQIYTEIKGFLTAFNTEFYESTFGDGVKVTVTKDGITVKDYDCGY